MTTHVIDAEASLLQEFAGRLQAPVVDSSFLPTDLVPIEGVGLDFLRRHAFVPLAAGDGSLNVYTAAPPDFAAIDCLHQFVAFPLRYFLAMRADVEALISRYYGDDAKTSEYGFLAGDGGEDDGFGPDDDIATLKALAEDAPVVRLVQLLIGNAFEARASDIHLEIYQNRFRVRYRIDGVLYDMESPPRRMYLSALSHLKLRSRMNIAERRLPQDGRIKMTLQDRDVDMRVSTIPTVYGESMVIRLLDQGPGVMDLTALGFDATALAQFEKVIRQPHGMVLVTGPTGSGKTTTLYAALGLLNHPNNKIITVEDPVEYQIDGINQMQVKAQIGLTFSSALRSIVRQDPDVIMIGEIRDRETAEIAIQSALTGHMVFSTLHTNDSFGAAHRLLEMEVESYLIASSVIMILAQRLVRMICPSCRAPVAPSDSDRLFLAEEGVAPDSAVQLYRGQGCSACAHTGYLGRTGIYELLPMSNGIKEAIIKKVPAEGVRRLALAEGVRTMRADGLLKVFQGITTLEELARVTRRES